MQWRSASADETEALGARLARALPRGLSQPLVVYLEGDLGAGKTTFARGFAQGCGIDRAVRSPTYTLVEVYESGAATLVHLDLYRLQDPDELEALGLRDLALAGHVWLIEWPVRGAGRLPDPDLRLHLAAGADAHHIEATACSRHGRMWLDALAGS